MSDRDTQTCLLIKITVIVPKNGEYDESCYKYEVVGVPTLTFTFNSKYINIQFKNSYIVTYFFLQNVQTFSICPWYLKRRRLLILN